jgi:hypothetical protein
MWITQLWAKSIRPIFVNGPFLNILDVFYDVISSAAADLRRIALAFANGGRGVEAAARFGGGELWRLVRAAAHFLLWHWRVQNWCANCPVLAAQNQLLGGARGAGSEKAPDKNDRRAATCCREANLSILAELQIPIFVLSLFLCDNKEIFSKPNFTYSDSLILNVSIQLGPFFNLKIQIN